MQMDAYLTWKVAYVYCDYVLMLFIVIVAFVVVVLFF